MKGWEGSEKNKEQGTVSPHFVRRGLAATLFNLLDRDTQSSKVRTRGALP